MKSRKVITLMALLLLSACGTEKQVSDGTSCAGSDMIGTWQSTQTDEVLTITEGCAYSSSKGDRGVISGEIYAKGGGSVIINLTEAGTLPAGVTDCIYVFSEYPSGAYNIELACDRTIRIYTPVSN